ncbi:CBASS cGAMP synthase [Mesorhizobium sp. M1136]|uniref:CBASS cGAMP synthase n=1 Tax=Mesorhizobium sp. M1136 TaxID=2957059 RepID=UPI00333C15AB
MSLANAHALFCGLKAEPSYLANLDVSDDERGQLMEARREIRMALKAAAARIQVTDNYWQESYRQKVSWRQRPDIHIKFMTQGSFAYRTLNDPAQKLTQEIDLDDGMYVPVQFIENGEPALAAKGLFEFVDAVLKPLCDARGWTRDPTKACCARVKLWQGAHIDIPIYSIPQDRFEQLRESLAKADLHMATRDSVKGAWKLPSDKIMLAQRDGSWVQSDPQMMHDWVEGRAERYGPSFRRLCRFFKGWRDYTWEKSTLSSICLMRAVDMALTELPGLPNGERDDELILEVAKRLPSIFEGKVANPVLFHLCINEWSNEDRGKINEGATALRGEMEAALERTGDAEQVVLKLRNRFGTRLPYRPDAVKIAPKISAIQKAPAAVVAAPRIIPSTSG